MSIAKRIYFGMGAMIALIVCVGGFASYEVSRLAQTFVDYRGTAKSSLQASDIAEDLFEARLASSKFRLVRDPKYVELAHENVAEVLAGVPALYDGMAAYRERDLLNGIPALMEEYAATLDNAVALQAQRNDLVEQTAALGLKARKQLTEIMETALRDNDAQASSLAGIASTNLLLGRFYLERFLVSNNPADSARSTEEIETARAGLQRLLVELQNPRRRDLAQQSIQDLDDFDTAAERVSEVILARNAQYARMDEIGPQALDDMETALDAVVTRQNTLGPAGAKLASNAIMLVATFVALGTLVGAALAFFTGRAVTRQLTKVTEDMSELADGNLDVDIEATEDKTEIAQMVNAMVVFRDNAQKARDLDAEVKEKERREHELKEQERQRAEEIEKEKREKEQRERDAERARMKVLEKFQNDMEKVLGAAAAGDFSNRMSPENDDQSLAALSDVINRLLEATETNIMDLVDCIDSLAQGDLGIRVEGAREGVFLRMKDDFNAALAALSQTMAQIMESGTTVSGTSSDLEAASRAMAKRAEQNAAALEETSAAVEEISASVRQVVANARAADEATQKARESANRTREVSNETEVSINAMTEASDRINSVVKVIEDIAFQINLLALNAGVEAARAGEAGRGFSVVASEVRALAQRSQEAVQEIGEVIEQNNLSVKVGVEKVGLSKNALEGIIAEVELASGQISEIATAVEQQSRGIDEINSSVRSIDSSSQESAASLEEMTASSVSLSDEAKTLADALGQFKGVPNSAPAPQSTNRVVPMRNSEPAPYRGGGQKVAVGGGGSVAEDTSGWEDF